MLNKRDIGNIVRECEHQNAISPVEVAGMTAAYAMVKNSTNYWSWEPQGWNGELEWICRLAKLVEPHTNGKFRDGPVTFWDEDTGNWEPINGSLAAELIPRALDSLVGSLKIFGGTVLADEFYQEFETIHPFYDGNGRVGNIIWRWLMDNEIGEKAWELENPPPFVSSKKKKEK